MKVTMEEEKYDVLQKENSKMDDCLGSEQH